MQAKLILNFDRLSEADFLTKADTILVALTGNPRFPEPWPAPEGFKVKHGAHSGSLAVRVKRVAGAGGYEVQTTQGDPTQETGWKHVLTALSSTRITLSDLPLMQSLWVRVRGIGIAGAGLWTEPVNIVVL